MEITVTISDERFNEIVKSASDVLTDEELKDAFAEGLKTYLSDHAGSILETKLIRRRDNGWGSASYEETALLTNLLSKLDYSKLQPIADEMIDKLKDKFSSVLVSAMAKVMLDGMFNSSSFDDAVRYAARNVVADAMRDNNNGY